MRPSPTGRVHLRSGQSVRVRVICQHQRRRRPPVRRCIRRRGLGGHEREVERATLLCPAGPETAVLGF